MRWLLLLMAWPLLALDNSVTITDAATTTHTARPVLVHRWFARGEIANYARPRVGGTALSVWQCDVKARWDDGTVRLAYVAWRQDIASGGSVTADFVNDTNRSSAGDDAATNAAAMDETAMLAASWNGIVEGTLNSVTYTANARTMVTAGKWSYYLRGPVVTWVVAEDRTAALAYDFGWQYSGGAWQAPTGEQYKSLHPVFTLQFWPAVGTHSAWPGVEVDAVLYNASTTRLQRIPLDKLRVLTGAAGTTESYCAGTGCSVTSAGTPNMIARRSWHAVVWSGTAPAEVVWDLNFPYLVYSKAIPSYDTSVAVPQAQTDSEVSDYSAMGHGPEWCTDATRCYLWVKYVPSTGGRRDIGVIPGWYSHVLYSMGSAWTVARKLDMWNKVMLGAADAGTSYPVHYLETGSRTGSRAYYDDAGTVAAFGQTVSLNSRQTVGLWFGEVTGATGVNALDPIDPVCTAAPCDGRFSAGSADYSLGWTPELSHQGSMFFVPALLTGRPFYIWEQYHLSTWAAQGHANARGGGNRTEIECGGGTWYGQWGKLALRGPNSGQMREAGWATRELFLGAAIASDDAPQQAYFAQRIRNNDAAWEGFFGVTDGVNPPADATCTGFAWDTSQDPWCVGNKGIAIFGANPLRIPHTGNAYSGVDYASAASCSAVAPWQTWFIQDTATWISKSGVVLTGGVPAFSRTRKEMAMFPLKRMLDSDSYPQALGMYQHPTTKYSTPTKAVFAESHTDLAALQDFTAVLQADITSSATTFSLSSASGGMGEFTGSPNWTFDAAIAVISIDDERILVCRTSGNPHDGPRTLTACTGGRGALGTAAAAHSTGAIATLTHIWHSDDYTGGYDILTWKGLALLADIDYNGYSGRKAFERAMGMIFSVVGVSRTTASPQWMFRPSSDPSNVRAVGLTGSVRLTYNAPDLGACRYTVASSLSDSSDSADTADSGGAVARSVTVGSLSAGTYRWRITCGTGRAIGSVAVQ